MSDSAMRQWTLVLVLTALFLSIVVVAQIVARYGAAYRAAPREIAGLLDSADSSLQENESYDRDVAKVPRRDDKIRLGRLLREIQRAGDDLREDLNSVLVLGGDDDSLSEKRAPPPRATSSSNDLAPSCPSPRLKTSARILWAAKRTRLEERLRRLDLLRMRFLVVYMSIVAATATAAAEKVEKSAAAATAAAAANASANTSTTCSTTCSSSAGSPPPSAAPSMPSSPRLPEKTTASIVAASIAAAAAAAVAAGDTDDVYYPSPSSPGIPGTPPGFGRPHPFLRGIQQQPSPPETPESSSSSSASLPGDLVDSLRRKPPLRRAATLGIRLPDASPEGNHRAGWMGVVQELQRSPLLHKRHTSIEMAMTRR